MAAGRPTGTRRGRLASLPFGLLIATWAATAGAGPVDYQCTGYRPLAAEFTPREAQLHFEGHDYTLQRVRDTREATFVDGRHGVTVVMRHRDLSLHLPGESLACKLQSAALQDLKAAPPPQASAPAPP